MKVLITGSNGYIGKKLVNFLIKNKIEIIAFGTENQKKFSKFLSYYIWYFNDALPKITYSNIDCAIHLAHDFNSLTGAKKSIKNTLNLIKHLNNAGVRKQFFFSSCSAKKKAGSIYGKTKYTIEKKLSNYNKVTIVRPGLVIGSGGIYQKIKKFINYTPLIILPDNGEGLVPIISMSNLCRVMLKLILFKKKYKEINLFNSYIPTLKELFLNSKIKKKKIFSINSKFLLKIIEFFEFIHIPLPIKKDNLLGFIANKKFMHKKTKLNFLLKKI